MQVTNSQRCWNQKSALRNSRIFEPMPLLSISKLSKSYRSPGGETRPILEIESFSMEPAQSIALRGESGSGKTTFLNIIAGILRADSGEALIDGEAMTSLSEPQRDALRAAK